MLGLYDYVQFVQDRHNIWKQRQVGSGSWGTPDPILASKKFTNVFRILDPGTQYVLTDLISADPVETLARIFLYRHTGRVEAWQQFRLSIGRAPVIADYRNGKLFDMFDQQRQQGKSVFTGAYIVRPQSQTAPNDYTPRNADKLKAVLARTLDMLDSGVAAEAVLAESPREQFDALKRLANVGDFMSMQTLVDFWYTPHGAGLDWENQFIVAGPGARRGAQHLYPKQRPEDTIEVLRTLLSDSGVRLDIGDGYTRLPSLMDTQNTLCEWSKYVRYAEQGAVNKPYRPAHPGRQPQPVYPDHWKGQ